MATPKVLIMRAPGTNCEVETAYAFELAGAKTTLLHINRLIESPDIAKEHQILCFPGGFSYGDDIAAGRILAQQLKVHLSDVVNHFRDRDHLVLGICNGLQIMMRLGIFFDAPEPPATLTLNRQARFEDRWVHLAATTNQCVFLRGIERMFLPTAHAEGRFVVRPNSSRAQFASSGQFCLRYCPPDAPPSDEMLDFPLNPNGADLNAAGLSDATGRIFGLMPHPERHIAPTHHPFWTRRQQQPEHGDGFAIFRNAVDYFS